MNRHLNALGAIFVAFGLMGLIAMMVVGALFIGGGLLGAIADGDPMPFGVAAMMGILITLVISVSAVPSLIAGYGLLTRRRWAPTVALIVGIINLVSFPLGTIMGLYAIWVYTRESTAEMTLQHG